MSEVPDVEISVVQGGKPVLNSGILRTHVVIGYASAGTFAAKEVDSSTLVSNFVSGDAVKACARAVDRVSAKAIFVRRNYTAVAATKTTTSTIAGTAIATVSGTPTEAYEYVLTITQGDTVVSSSIDYSLSLDNGETETTGTIASTGILSLGGGLTLTLDPPTNALVALANDIRAQCLIHFPKIAGSVHGAADTASDDGFAAVATTNATALTLANTLRTGILAHFALGAATHTAADTTNGTGIPAAATTLQQARLLLIALKSALNAHEQDLAYHGLADTALVTEASPSSGTLATNDEVLVSTTDPSPAILSLAISGSGSATVTASGTPLETIRGRVEFLTAGTIGTEDDGIITYRVSLDGGATWQSTATLGVATSIALVDKRVDETTTPTGVTLNLVATETVDVDTVITFRTTAPRVAIADVLLAIDAAAASSFKQRGWKFYHIVGDYSASEMAQVQTKLNTLQASKQWNYAMMQFRDKRPYETEDAWKTDIVAQRAAVNLNRVASYAGYARTVTCPLTNRLDRRPAAWLDAVRRLCVEINVESGRKKDGPLGSEVNGKVGGEGSSGDVTLYEDGERLEYDADVDSTLPDARISTLRTFTNEGSGVYFTGSMLATGPASKFKRTRDRDLNDEASRALSSDGIRQLLDNVRRNPGDYPNESVQPGDPGTILEADALTIESEAKTAVSQRIGSKANLLRITVSRTDNLTGTVPRIITETLEIEGQPVIEGVSATQIFNG